MWIFSGYATPVTLAHDWEQKDGCIIHLHTFLAASVPLCPLSREVERGGVPSSAASEE